jgi:hypothetical protein
MDEFRFNYFCEEFPLRQTKANLELQKIAAKRFFSLTKSIKNKLELLKIKRLSKIESIYLDQLEQNRVGKRQDIQRCKRWDRYI